MNDTALSFESDSVPICVHLWNGHKIFIKFWHKENIFYDSLPFIGHQFNVSFPFDVNTARFPTHMWPLMFVLILANNFSLGVMWFVHSLSISHKIPSLNSCTAVNIWFSSMLNSLVFFSCLVVVFSDHFLFFLFFNHNFGFSNLSLSRQTFLILHSSSCS